MLGRRDFLKALGFLATFPLIGWFLEKYKFQTEIVPPPPQKFADTPEDMLGGEVVKIEGRRMEVRTTRGIQTVVLAADVVIDEGAWTATFPIAPGDHLFMVGHVAPGNWVADKVWVNAVNITGEIRKCSLKRQEVVCEIKTTRPLDNENLVQGWLPRKYFVGKSFDPTTGILLELWKGKRFRLKEGAFVRIVGRMYQGRLCIINVFDEK